MRTLIFASVWLACGVGSHACSRPPAAVQTQEAAVEQPASAPTAPRADLPFAGGMSFASLDDYLAHLRRRGTYDVPWYREVSPGVYERVVGRGAPGQTPQRFTREELERKYGFRP